MLKQVQHDSCGFGMIHDYFGVDIDAVWDTVQNDIPSLNNQLKELL